MTDLLKFSRQPALKNPSLVIGWNGDAGRLGSRITDYLNNKLAYQSFCQIEPVEFFPLGGVAVQGDLIRFPESKFFDSPNNDLLVFKSPPPNHEWYTFLNALLQVAQDYCHVREIHAIGGMVSLGAHTSPRELAGTFNMTELKERLGSYGLAGGWDYETPAGQRPTLNSFLLWAAKRRNIPAVSLWVPVPFYLIGVEDHKAQKTVLDFLNRRFHLNLDFTEIDEKIRDQDNKIFQVRQQSANVNDYITRLESHLELSPEENETLVREVEKALRTKSR